MNIVLDLTGVADVTTMLQGVSDRMIDETPAMQAIETVMLRSAQLNFVEQGRPTPWVPLKEATVKQRRGNGEGAQILRDTGLLMQSIAPGAGNEYSTRDVTPQSVQIGTNRPGASAHQYGSARMPQRMFLEHQEQDISDYKIIIADFLVHGLGGGDQVQVA